MEIEHLPGGRILLQLDDEQIWRAEALAEEREKVRRIGKRGERIAEGDKTHLRGAMAEIGSAAYYQGTHLAHVGSTDGGVDFIHPDGTRWQVKSTHNRHRKAPHLYALEWDHLTADYYLLCVVDVMAAEVELCGYATHDELSSRPVIQVTQRKTGRKIPTRAIPESALRRCAKQPERVEDDPSEEDPWPLRPDVSNWADNERCSRLLKVIDKPGGVFIPKLGKLGRLVNAQPSIPHFPPGVRVVLDGETEIVKGSDTKKNPRGEPISRDFHSEEVEIA